MSAQFSLISRCWNGMKFIAPKHSFIPFPANQLNGAQSNLSILHRTVIILLKLIWNSAWNHSANQIIKLKSMRLERLIEIRLIWIYLPKWLPNSVNFHSSNYVLFPFQSIRPAVSFIKFIRQLINHSFIFSCLPLQFQFKLH